MENKFKKIKFKDDCLSAKKHFQIIFEDKNIKTFHGMMDAPSNWHHKKEKRIVPSHIHKDAPIRKDMTSIYYKGKLVNNLYEGFGTEIKLDWGNYLKDVVSFYKGNWKNGKKNGKGYWSNHHPLIGRTWSLDAMKPYFTIMDDDAYFYDGNWKDDKKHGKGCLNDQDGYFEGEFKDDFKWNGVLQVGVDEIIFNNGKKDLSRILPEKERFLKQIENEEYVNLDKVNKDIKDDKNLMIKYITVWGFGFGGISKRLKNDKDVIIAAIKKLPHNITDKSINKKYLKDKDIIKILLSENSLKKMHIDVFKILDDKYKKNKNFVIKLMKYLREDLFFCLDKKLRNDKDIISNHIKHIYNAKDFDKLLSKIDKKYLKNKKFVLSILKKEHSDKLFGESKIYLKLNTKLKNDREIIYAALNYKWKTLNKMNASIKNNRKLMLDLTKKERGLYQYLKPKFKKEDAFLLAAKQWSPLYDKKLKKVILKK